MARLTTIAVGTLGNADSSMGLRLLRDENGGYRVLAGTLGEAHATEAAAREAFERAAKQPVTWRTDLQARSSEHPCPICTAPVALVPRYPRRICPACEQEACDAGGKSVRFGSASFGGGLAGWYVADGSVYTESHCFVRGALCKAQEGRFGGAVIQVPASE